MLRAVRSCVMVEGQEGVTWHQWLALADATERLGFEGLFRSDHYFSAEGVGGRGSTDAWTLLAALAARTDRIRLGTLVSPVRNHKSSWMIDRKCSFLVVTSGKPSSRSKRIWPAADGRNIDQLAGVIEQLKSNPNSRRIIVSAWNVGELDQMALLPCHALFQFYVAGRRLSCQLYQRSADALLGVPFNIASYALLTHMLAQQCDLQVGEFIWTGGDCHLYLNHLEQADLQLSRAPFPLPKLKIRRKPPSLFEYSFEDFEVLDYRHHAGIKAPISV
jgi:thymidylate synthase